MKEKKGRDCELQTALGIMRLVLYEVITGVSQRVSNYWSKLEMMVNSTSRKKRSGHSAI